jgi:DNA modification methylase
METFLGGKIVLHPGDCLDVLATLPESSVDAVVTDPPYHLTSIVKRFGGENAAPVRSKSNLERDDSNLQLPTNRGGGGTTSPYQRVSTGFMGKVWDGGDIAFQPETWAAVLRVMKPGAHLLAFGGTRTFARMSVAIEDAGFEIRDTIMWVYGSGFPKSHDVSKGIDKAAGVRGHDGQRFNAAGVGASNGGSVFRSDHPNYVKPRGITEAAQQWEGWGTALKPAVEPIVMARKPLSEGTMAANVLRWGTGAINVGACRVGHNEPEKRTTRTVGKFAGVAYAKDEYSLNMDGGNLASPNAAGRWPANLIHDGSDEVVGAFPDNLTSGRLEPHHAPDRKKDGLVYGKYNGLRNAAQPFGGDSGSAARFFYTAKADADDRLGSRHPTVKPVDLMQYLCRLVCPKGGTVLDPFTGTGTTGEAAWREGMRAVLIEAEPEYQEDIRRRMALALAGPDEKLHAIVKAKGLTASPGPLFDGLDDYNSDDDVTRSLEEAYREIRERKAAGGPGWEPQ